MLIRKGKSKSLLDSSINFALLAVEIYNKPRTPFRVEGFITHMIMAWTRLFHSHFNYKIGDKFFYKEKGKYKIIDGEKKAWELKTCITKYGQLQEAVKVNLEFFIRLRNKIEHRNIDKDEIGIMIFGECQSLLYNYENELVKLFGIEYALNENLAYSNWNSLSENDKKNYEKVTALVKDKVIKTEVINPGKLKPGKVIQEINKNIDFKINHADHKCILATLGIRPYNEFEKITIPLKQTPGDLFI